MSTAHVSLDGRSAWLRWLLVSVVCIGIAHALDGLVWRELRLPGVNEKDWGRLLRSMGYLPLWGLLGVAYWLHQQDVPSRGRSTALLVLSPALSGVVAEVMKLLVRRLRPDPELFGYAFRAFADGPWSNRGMGMPSSHVLVAFGGAFALARLYPRARWVWFTLAAGCALTRILSLGHFLSDTVVAACVAWAVVTVLSQRLQPSDSR